MWPQSWKHAIVSKCHRAAHSKDTDQKHTIAYEHLCPYTYKLHEFLWEMFTFLNSLCTEVSECRLRLDRCAQRPLLSVLGFSFAE